MWATLRRAGRTCSFELRGPALKIVHMCFAAPYNQGWTYQENMLPAYHCRAGHGVTVLAMPFQIDEETGRFGPYSPGVHTDESGVQVIRARLLWGGPKRRWSRFHLYRGIYRDLSRIEPDVVFIHGLQFMNLQSVSRYCRSHPNTRVFVDNHADFHNSAHGILSRKLVHGVLWRLGLQSVHKYVTRYWGITEESCDFLSELYGIPRHMVELLPLGAGVDVQDDDVRAEVRARVRQRLGVGPSEVLMITGGKIDSRKRVHEIMRAVHEMGRQELKLLVFGSVLPDIRATFDTLVEEPSVTYVGWTDASTITEYLIAADLAVFPGGQSVLWMHAVVCGVPCIFRRWPKGSPVDIGGNCVFLETAEYGELLSTLEGILSNRAIFERMCDAALSPERWKYSYANIAARAIDEQ